MEKALLVFKSKDGDKAVELSEGATLFAGRTIECDIYLPSPSVSRKHAVFVMRGGLCGVKDLDSSNGTFLNGTRLAKPSRLREGDSIQIGGYSIEFSVARAPAFADADSTILLQLNEAPAAPRPKPEQKPAPKAEQKIEQKAEPKPAPAPEPKPEPAPAVLPVPASAPGKKAASGTSARRIHEAADKHTRRHTRIAEEALQSPAETSAAEIARDSLRLMQRIPAAPKLQPAAVEEDLTDDLVDAEGGGDAAYAKENKTPVADEPDEAAVAMDPDEANALRDSADAGPAEGSDGEPGAASEKSDLSPVFDAIGAVDLPPKREADPNAMPISQDLRDAVEARLYLYSFLNDMQKERKELAAGLQAVPEAVQAELDRQDREMLKIIPPDKAEQMIQSRMARRMALKEKIEEAKRSGADMPPRPSKAMRQAEDIAINQWTIIAQSGKEALPAAMLQGYKVVESEPLAGILSGAGIEPATLMGGGAYYLALEQLQEETKYNRAFLRAKLAQLPDPNDRKAGNAGLRGMFGKKAEENPEDGAAPAPGESYGELRDAEAHMADRGSWIAQELGTLEPMLIKEFWSVYTKAALHFLRKPEEITLALRAFLRYGVIGFMPWWMSEEVREHVTADCSKDVAEHLEVSRNNTNILYADEYLSAVLRNECTPALDENLEINAKNSPEWKADKALRRVINTKSQIKLLSELVDTLQSRIDGVEREGAAIEDKMKALLPGQKNFKQLKSELGLQRQAFKVEASKLTKLEEKIKNETIAQLRETAAETEARFSSGELPFPTEEFLITRECEALRKIGRLLANLKERFMPLVMRDFFHPGTDAVNDRNAIRGEIADVEKRDPRIFLETLVDSKKKANRVDVRISPVMVLIPSAGILAFSWNPRQKPEDGRLAIPTCFIRRRLRERQMMYLMADFRWDTSKAGAGMDVMASETIVAAFMGVRWDWRKRTKEGREKGLVFTDQNDRTNWRRVYEAYMQTAYDSGKKLFNRNYDFYERIIGKYFDLPEGVELLRK